jgi:hypothetical protein
MSLKLVVWLGTGLYALLSAADWTMTHALLRSNPAAVEANPLAAACLEQHGWDGLAVYKCGSVLMFVGAVALLLRRRPSVAAGVVALGCAVLVAVTVYTHGLIRDARRDVSGPAAAVELPAPPARPCVGPDATAQRLPGRLERIRAKLDVRQAD